MGEMPNKLIISFKVASDGTSSKYFINWNSFPEFSKIVKLKDTRMDDFRPSRKVYEVITTSENV